MMSTVGTLSFFLLGWLDFCCFVAVGVGGAGLLVEQAKQSKKEPQR
jgi:hypothetical protein